jgi:hypothetical protein
VIATSPKFALPSGVRVGMDAVDVAERLRFFYASIAVEDHLIVALCGNVGGVNLFLTFAEEGKRSKLVKIEIAYEEE